MNYYERHIGDYLKDTAHLSLLEHGVYTRLMDVYYTREGGLLDAEVGRLIGAKSKDERAALGVVLAEFFKRDGDMMWKQARCDLEIARYQKKATHNREVGKLGGRPRKAGTQTEPTNNPGGFQTEPTQNPIQYPVSSIQSSEAIASAAVAAPAEQTKAELWEAGKSLLLEAGVPKGQCGTFVGKLVQDYGDGIVIDAVRSAVVATPADPKEYLKAACMRLKGERGTDHDRAKTVPSGAADATQRLLREQAEHARVVEEQRLARIAARQQEPA